MTPKVEAAIEQVYLAFADVKHPSELVSCPCCNNRELKSDLVTGDLQSVDIKALSIYSAKAITTIGSKEDYLYFLPAILAAEVTKSGFGIGFEVTGGKIGAADPASWDSHCREAVENYFAAVLEAVASGHLRRLLDISGVLCTIGRSGFKLGPYLEMLDQWPDAIGEFHEENAGSLAAKQRLQNAFWERLSQDVVIEWLETPEIEAVLEDFYRRR